MNEPYRGCRLNAQPSKSQIAKGVKNLSKFKDLMTDPQFAQIALCVLYDSKFQPR